MALSQSPPPKIDNGSAFGRYGITVMGIVWSFVPVTTILAIARIYVRFKIKRNERQDWALCLALLAWIMAVLDASFMTISAYHGLGIDKAQLSSNYSYEKTKYLVISTVFSQLASAIAKASVAAFLLAIQGQVYRRYAWLLYFLAITNVLINITWSFLIIYTCDPPESAWGSKKGNCYIGFHITYPFNIFQCVWNGISDLILAIYPAFIIYPLRLAARIKILLCCLMGLGVIASAFSFVRLRRLTTVQLAPPTNKTTILLFIWTQVEMWVVLLVLSIPPVWPILKLYIKIVNSYGISKQPTPDTSSNSGSGKKPSRPFQAAGITTDAWYGMSAVPSPHDPGVTRAVYAQGVGTRFEESNSDEVILLYNGIKKSDDTIKVMNEVTVTGSNERAEEPQGSHKTLERAVV